MQIWAKSCDDLSNMRELIQSFDVIKRVLPLAGAVQVAQTINNDLAWKLKNWHTLWCEMGFFNPTVNGPGCRAHLCLFAQAGAWVGRFATHSN
jgi:hypothetical protein